MLVPVTSFTELKKCRRIRYVQIIMWGLFPSVTPIRLRLQRCSPCSSSSHGMLSRAQVNKQQRPSSQPLKIYLLVFQRILVLDFLFSISNYRPIMFPSSLNAQTAARSTPQHNCKRAQLSKKKPTEKTEELQENFFAFRAISLSVKRVWKILGCFRKHPTWAWM